MSSRRVDTPTPAGGEYYVAVFVMLDTLEEVDERVATGVFITEYAVIDGADRLIAETVAPYQYTP